MENNNSERKFVKNLFEYGYKLAMIVKVITLFF